MLSVGFVVVVGGAAAGNASGGSGVSVANVEVVVELADVAPDEQPTRSTDAQMNAKTNPLMAVSLASDLV
jgi:hypothetical protein